MSKAARLAIEAMARAAVASHFNCTLHNQRVEFPNDGPIHEFDIYASGVVIGGVSTSPLCTSNGNRNTGGCDRAASELLWLSLWPGGEQRIHVLVNLLMAEWLVKRYRGVMFQRDISIYHFEVKTDSLRMVGTLPGQ